MPLINDPDSLKWGRLVKSWATRLDYVTTRPEQQPPHPPAGAMPAGAAWALPPLNPVSFTAQVGAETQTKQIPGVLWLTKEQFTGLVHGAGVSTPNYPDGITEVIIVQGDATRMMIRLPPAGVLQSSEQSLLGGMVYPTPTFYIDLFTDKSDPAAPVPEPHPPAMPDVKGLMNLHANRIGDYTMGLCA